MIVSPAILPTRDIAVHEAGHFVVGQSFGMPVLPPVISDDRQSGYVAVDIEPMPPDTDRKAFFSRIEPTLLRKLAMRRAVFCLSGYAAECRLARSHWGANRIVCGGSDLALAKQALDDAGCNDSDLYICWQRARLAVDRHWSAISEMARKL